MVQMVIPVKPPTYPGACVEMKISGAMIFPRLYPTTIRADMVDFFVCPAVLFIVVTIDGQNIPANADIKSKLARYREDNTITG